MSFTIQKTMKAAQLVQYKKKYEINEIPIPEYGENDLLVKVGAAGFCHTDYQVWEGVYKSPFPTIPSHEPVGTIVAVGSKAQKKWKIGQRVGVGFFRHQCHNCIGCELTGDIRWCENKEMGGLHDAGGMAEYIIGDADTCVMLPDSLPFEQAAPLMCAGATIWAGIIAADVKPGQAIGILGIGGLGSLGVQFAKAMGYRVVAIDNRPEGRALAQELTLKADLVLDDRDDKTVEKIKAWAGKGGLAGIVVATDDVKAIEWSTQTLRPLGVCVPLGLPTTGITFDAFAVVFQAYTIKGSLVASTAQIQEMMWAVDKFNIRSHVSTVPLEQTPNLPDLYMDPHLKGRLVMKISS